MPKRVIDFDAMWGSDKLAACAAWAQAEYAWLYGLADASGCFEVTNLRVIWGRVAAIRGNLTIERLEQVFAEFQDKGLLFVWEHEGKRYAHWTGSDVPGRLPPPSWRMRLERFAPPVPKQQFAEYMAKFARGRAALAGVGFRGEAPRESCGPKENFKFENSDLREERGAAGGQDCKFENAHLREARGGGAQGSQLTDPRLLRNDHGADCRGEISDSRQDVVAGERFRDSRAGERRGGAAAGGGDGMARESRSTAGWSGIKEGLEGTQAQDLGLNWNLNGNWEVGREVKPGGPGDERGCLADVNRGRELTRTDSFDSKSNANANSHSNENSDSEPKAKPPLYANTNSSSQPNAPRYSGFNSNSMSGKELAVWRELRVGQGPVCGPAGVKPEVLERIRRREAARAGSRSP